MAEKNVNDQLQPYRQPMVTATGILLGFALNFSSNWIPKAFSTERVAEIIIAVGFCLNVSLYTIVLYRILNNDYPQKTADSYYKTTLRMLILSIAIWAACALTVMIESIVIHKA